MHVKRNRIQKLMTAGANKGDCISIRVPAARSIRETMSLWVSRVHPDIGPTKQTEAMPLWVSRVHPDIGPTKQTETMPLWVSRVHPDIGPTKQTETMPLWVS